ncbi:hypothetical protein Tco_0735748 [Tanacetum coccineum]
MKWVSKDPSYITGGEPEYPRELFLGHYKLRIPVVGVHLVSTLGTISSIPIGGSISPEGFLYSIMLLVVIIVTVVIVIVILIVVVVDDVSLILKFSSVIIGWAYAFHQDKASSVRVPVANIRPTAPSVPLKGKKGVTTLRTLYSYPIIATGVPSRPVFLLGLLVISHGAACLPESRWNPKSPPDPRNFVMSLDFLNDLFEIRNSKVSKSNLISLS